jgi:hypothetical protein
MQEEQYIDLSQNGENAGLQQAQEVAKQQLDQMLNSEEFKALPIFEQIKKTMDKFGVQVKDPKQSCNKCYGRGYTGKKKGSGEPIPCSCIMPDMNFSTEQAYENRSQLPQNRRERRAMLRMMTKKQGNFTKKQTKGRVKYWND